MGSIKVLIVDDQHLFVEGLKVVLQGESRGRIEVVGVAEDGKQALAKAESCGPDVVLMDIRMPVMDGVEATGLLHAKYPAMKILILTTFDDDELAVEALNQGATGYVIKDVDPSDLILSIEAVHRGAYYLSGSVGFKLLDTMHPDADSATREKELVLPELLRATPSLTRREAEVAYHTAKAHTNKQIADLLFIAEKTVKNHLLSIYEKLGIHSRLALFSHVSSLLRARSSPTGRPAHPPRP